MYSPGAKYFLPELNNFRYLIFNRSTVTELAGKLCVKSLPAFWIGCVTGATLVGFSKVFSSVGFSDASTIAVTEGWTSIHAGKVDVGLLVGVGRVHDFQNHFIPCFVQTGDRV